MPHNSRIAGLLINAGAVSVSVDPPFTWATGVQLPVYCDTRMLYSHPDARDIVIDALLDRMSALHIEPDVIAGTASGATGWAAILADRLRVPFVYVRKQSKLHGMKKRIEGDIKPEQHVVVIEDVILTGTSAIAATEALREHSQALVTDIVSIFSYEMEVALENAQEAAVKLHSICTFEALLNEAIEQGRLEVDILQEVRNFSKNPAEWSKTH